MKIALGTVQFGMSYGISNNVGQVNSSDAKDIMLYAKSVGIDTLDTAIAYGDSERCLGEVGINDWNVITKLPEVPDDCACISSWITGQIENSLMNLELI